MKRTVASAVVLAATVALTISACGSSGGSGSASSGGAIGTDGKGKTVKIWLQSDAQKGWPAVVDQANQRFEQATGAKVQVEWQQWSNYTTKLDSTFAGSTGVPDVVELGNTQTASYIAGGAFKNLTSVKSSFENSSTWLKGLAESGTSPEWPAAGHPVLRRQPGRHLPQGPLGRCGRDHAADHARRAERRPGQDQGREPQGRELLGVLHARQVLVRRDVVRLRCGRHHRVPVGRQVAGPAGEQPGPAGAVRVGRSWRRRTRPAGRPRTSPTRTRSWRRATSRRSSATAGRSVR